MKLATLTLVGIVLLGALAPMKAADPVAASQVVLAFSGGSVFTSDTTGICVWYPVLLGDFELRSLFTGPLFGAPVVDKEHAYFIWVSDFSMQVIPPSKDFPDFNFLALIPTGTATIYYTNRPDLRDWSDWHNRSTWGEPVAKFVRQAGFFYSGDDGMTGPMTSTAELVSSTEFSMFQKKFDFADLMPQGMTCYELGIGESEAGTCVATGAGRKGVTSPAAIVDPGMAAEPRANFGTALRRGRRPGRPTLPR
jgi:hypothetical protein